MEINWYAVWLFGGGFLSAYWVDKYPWFAWPFMFVVLLTGWMYIKLQEMDIHNNWEKINFEFKLLGLDDVK